MANGGLLLPGTGQDKAMQFPEVKLENFDNRPAEGLSRKPVKQLTNRAEESRKDALAENSQFDDDDDDDSSHDEAIALQEDICSLQNKVSRIAKHSLTST